MLPRIEVRGELSSGRAASYECTAERLNAPAPTLQGLIPRRARAFLDIKVRCFDDFETHGFERTVDLLERINVVERNSAHQIFLHGLVVIVIGVEFFGQAHLLSPE